MRFGPPPRMMTLRRSVGSASHSAGRSAVALVAGIHVGRARGELGGAGVDALVDRPHAQRAAPLGDLGRGQAGELGQPLVGEALLLEVEQRLGVLRQAVLARTSRLDLHELLDLAQEPRLVLARRARSPRPTGRGGTPGRSPAGGPASAAPARRRSAILSGAPLISISLRPVRPVSIERSAFCSDSWKVRPIAIASPTALHRGGEQRLGAGELLEGEARHLGDDVVDRRLERGRRRRR